MNALADEIEQLMQKAVADKDVGMLAGLMCAMYGALVIAIEDDTERALAILAAMKTVAEAADECSKG